METRRLLSAASYFSIFVAGFIIPIVIYFITNDSIVRYHAKKAFISHILPFFSLLFLFISFFTLPDMSIFIISSVLCGVLYLAVMIYNIIQGIRIIAGHSE
ncbi:DUF4870 domain-containing protein [Paenibacillus sp. YYML68]|uniref:DUF4870 domain-containing protein n=1 Tax=Paenibacillus sp. YYML68 TaxID=2909250 RepID=UPI00248F7CD9|nr:DUF4870 domain-containing protein [Paenibacillus sp. YYML68]